MSRSSLSPIQFILPSDKRKQNSMSHSSLSPEQILAAQKQHYHLFYLYLPLFSREFLSEMNKKQKACRSACLLPERHIRGCHSGRKVTASSSARSKIRIWNVWVPSPRLIITFFPSIWNLPESYFGNQVSWGDITLPIPGIRMRPPWLCPQNVTSAPQRIYSFA